MRKQTQLKRTAHANVYFDAMRNLYKEEEDYFYPLAPSGETIRSLRLMKRDIIILSHETSSEITTLSPEQKDKGIGIRDEKEKVLRVLRQGDCNDGGSQQVDIFERQRRQVLNALDDGG